MSYDFDVNINICVFWFNFYWIGVLNKDFKDRGNLVFRIENWFFFV